MGQTLLGPHWPQGCGPVTGWPASGAAVTARKARVVLGGLLTGAGHCCPHEQGRRSLLTRWDTWGRAGGRQGGRFGCSCPLGTPLLRPIAPAWWLMGGHPEVPGAAGWRALTMFAVDASPPWGTGACAVSGVTGCLLPTPAHMGTAGAKAALWTGCREEMGGWPSRAGPVPLPCRDEAGREGSPVPGPRGRLCWGPGPLCRNGDSLGPYPAPVGPAGTPDGWKVPA